MAVEAEIHQLHGLSAHADQAELLRWLATLPGQPARIFLNHGEDHSRKVLSAAVVQTGLNRPELPANGTSVPW